MYCSMKVPQFYFFLMDKMVYSFFKPLKSKQQSDQKFAMEMKKISIFSKIFGSKCLLLPNTEFCRNILHNGKFLDQFHGCLARFSSTSLGYVWMHWSHFFLCITLFCLLLSNMRSQMSSEAWICYSCTCHPITSNTLCLLIIIF